VDIQQLDTLNDLQRASIKLAATRLDEKVIIFIDIKPTVSKEVKTFTKTSSNRLQNRI
jgi:hypothetical protein